MVGDNCAGPAAEHGNELLYLWIGQHCLAYLPDLRVILGVCEQIAAGAVCDSRRLCKKSVDGGTHRLHLPDSIIY
jgi:hypothetical protein